MSTHLYGGLFNIASGLAYYLLVLHDAFKLHTCTNIRLLWPHLLFLIQPLGFSLLRNKVFLAFIAPAPVPSAVMDHTLMYGLMNLELCSRAKGRSNLPTCSTGIDFHSTVSEGSRQHLHAQN